MHSTQFTGYVCKFVALVFPTSENYFFNRDYNDMLHVKCHADLLQELLKDSQDDTAGSRIYCGTLSYGIWETSEGQSYEGIGLITNGPPDVVRSDIDLPPEFIRKIVEQACGDELDISSILNLSKYC